MKAVISRSRAAIQAAAANTITAEPTVEEHLKKVFQLHHDPDDDLDLKLQAETLESYSEDLEYIRGKWESSPHRNDLIGFVEKKILPVKDLQITTALCLGLGSLEAVFGVGYYDTWQSGKKGEFWQNNFTFFQLLLFETVIDILKKRFNIQSVAFQDPDFTAADKTFLEQRGHTVVTYPAREMAKATYVYGTGLDPNIERQYSDDTFLFAPYLDKYVLVPVVKALRPNLYLGTELLQLTIESKLTDVESPSAPLMLEFDNFAWSRDFKEVLILDDGGYLGFHWPRDPKDDSALKKLQERFREQQGRSARRKQWADRQKVRLVAEEKPEEALKRMEQEKEILHFQDKFQSLWKERAEKEGNESVKKN